MTPVDGYNLETFKQQCIESFTSNDVQQSVYFYDATQKTLLLTVVKDLENEEYYKTCFEENKEIQVETFKQLCEGFAKQHDVPAEKEQDSQPKEMTSADKEETTKITSSAEESYDDLGKTIVEFNDKEGITGEMQKWIKYFKSIITNTLENPPEATNSGLNDILQQYSAAVVNQAIIAIRIINNIILNFNELQTKEQIQKRVELFNNVVYDFYERQSQEKNEITKILEAKRGTEEVRQSLTTLEQNLAESICAIKKEAEKEAPGQESGHQK